MTGYVFEMFGISLALTLLLELLTGYCLGMRHKRQILLLILVNILTNPAAVLLCWYGMPQIVVEIGVVLTELAVYLWFFRDSRYLIPHPVLLAVLCNGISWTVGLVIQRIGG